MALADEDVCQWRFKLNAILADSNTTQNYTSIDANNALENSNCGSTDADKRNKQRFNNIISMHEAVCVCLLVFTQFLQHYYLSVYMFLCV